MRRLHAFFKVYWITFSILIAYPHSHHRSLNRPLVSLRETPLFATVVCFRLRIMINSSRASAWTNSPTFHWSRCRAFYNSHSIELIIITLHVRQCRWPQPLIVAKRSFKSSTTHRLKLNFTTDSNVFRTYGHNSSGDKKGQATRFFR